MNLSLLDIILSVSICTLDKTTHTSRPRPVWTGCAVRHEQSMTAREPLMLSTTVCRLLRLLIVIFHRIRPLPQCILHRFYIRPDKLWRMFTMHFEQFYNRRTDNSSIRKLRHFLCLLRCGNTKPNRTRDIGIFPYHLDN